jgi:hypothetical protein
MRARREQEPNPMIIPHENLGLRFLSPFYRRPPTRWQRARLLLHDAVGVLTLGLATVVMIAFLWMLVP